MDKKPVIGNGCYRLNEVMVNDKEILPVYCDIYSLDREVKYEKKLKSLKNIQKMKKLLFLKLMFLILISSYFQS